jgi:uncharacterized membrane protein (UPF0127 family)
MIKRNITKSLISIVKRKSYSSLTKDAKICKSIWSKTRGLMFRKKNYTIPLLFIFDKPGKYPIHSFFCRKFIAVWLVKRKIVDVKIIHPWKNNISPNSNFDELLEIPLNNDGKTKHLNTRRDYNI